MHKECVLYMNVERVLTFFHFLIDKPIASRMQATIANKATQKSYKKVNNNKLSKGINTKQKTKHKQQQCQKEQEKEKQAIAVAATAKKTNPKNVNKQAQGMIWKQRERETMKKQVALLRNIDIQHSPVCIVHDELSSLLHIHRRQEKEIRIAEHKAK